MTQYYGQSFYYWYGDYFTYNYVCGYYNVNPNTIQCNDYYTGWNDPGPGNTIIYLDRHDVNCPNGAALNGFEGMTSNSRFQYHYRCCSAMSPSPTPRPVANPTPVPIAKPTLNPTLAPIASPTLAPSAKPTLQPTSFPVAVPTLNPTLNPTLAPTKAPISNPTEAPTMKPTFRPTYQPTSEPIANPTKEPTLEPTGVPHTGPTKEPIPNPTQEPSAEPTDAPIARPTHKPTEKPTVKPSREPSALPTETPTLSPTFEPTAEPSYEPSPKPSHAPTFKPSVFPTESPSAKPTMEPTQEPTFFPTFSPTSEPIADPTEEPTMAPTFAPNTAPTVIAAAAAEVPALPSAPIVILAPTGDNDDAPKTPPLPVSASGVPLAISGSSVSINDDALHATPSEDKKSVGATGSPVPAPVSSPVLHSSICSFTFVKGSLMEQIPDGCVFISDANVKWLSAGDSTPAMYACNDAKVTDVILKEANLIDAQGKSLVSTIIPGAGTSAQFFSTGDFNGRSDTFTSGYYRGLDGFVFKGLSNAAGANDAVQSILVTSNIAVENAPPACTKTILGGDTK